MKNALSIHFGPLTNAFTRHNFVLTHSNLIVMKKVLVMVHQQNLPPRNLALKEVVVVVAGEVVGVIKTKVRSGIGR